MTASAAYHKKREGNSLATELIAGDLRQQQHIHRPQACHGMALHYKVVRDGDALARLVSLLLQASKTDSSGSPPLNAIYAVVVSVAITGLGYAYPTSTVGQRLEQAIQAVTSTRKIDLNASKTIMATLLLAEEDDRATNDMVGAQTTAIVTPAKDETSDASSRIKLLKTPGKRRDPAALVNSSHHVANMAPEAVSVGDGAHVALVAGSAQTSRQLAENMNVLAIAENDTRMIKYATSGQERIANLDLTGKSSRFFRSKRAMRSDPDLDGFEYRGSKRDNKTVTSTIPVASHGPATRRMSAQVGGIASPPVAVPPSRRASAMGGVPSRRGVRGRPQLQSDEPISTTGSSSARSTASSVTPIKLQVNTALNEDLTCSYKQSKLSSCSIEGVVQVQVKPSEPVMTPFLLRVRDSSKHLENLQENKKFASAAPLNRSSDRSDDYKFSISVPNTDNYFPVLKYKCVSDLRPVPIRVQTKTNLGSGYCQVSLQISSNPDNEAPLTDLNIIMGIPGSVRGESLRTQPAGGVWNEEKRSVVWFVSELVGGEKFQLHTRFELAGDGGGDLDFPVIVRCTCLFAQLSDIDIEVMPSPERSSEVVMKVARRFRLVHRERP